MLEVLKNLFAKIVDLFLSGVKVGDSKPKPKPKSPKGKLDLEFRNYEILKTARKEIGVKEVAGSGNNAKVVKYHAFATKDNKKGMNDSVPWCSSFVCWVVENTFVKGKHIGSTNSMAARSWLKWGVSTKNDPLPGDIVVYWRGKKDGWQGHTGFYLGSKGDYIYTLGGNQRDSVNISTYHKVKLLDIRRSSKHIKLDEVQEDFLYDLADDILQANGIKTGGKVS